MAMGTDRSRTLLSAAMAAIVVLFAACGGGAGGGPDTSQAEKGFLDNLKMQVDGQARFVSFKETSRKSDEMEGVKSCEVQFEGEIEFTGPCYYQGDRKKGDRVKFDASIPYVKDASGWKEMMGKGFYIR